MHHAPEDVLTEAYAEEEFWQDLLAVLGHGYAAGVDMTIGRVFGRIAGAPAAAAARRLRAVGAMGRRPRS